MTGYQSKKAAALDEDGMYLVHHTQPAQEPVAWMYQCSDEFGWRDEIQFVQPPNHPVFRNVVALYTAPSAAQPAQERNFCSRCGKRTADLTVIHTCTPPQEIYENRKN